MGSVSREIPNTLLVLRHTSCGISLHKLRAPIFSVGYHHLSLPEARVARANINITGTRSGGDGDYECSRVRMGFIEGGGRPASHGECGECDRAASCAREKATSDGLWEEKVESEGGRGLKLRAKYYMEGLRMS